MIVALSAATHECRHDFVYRRATFLCVKRMLILNDVTIAGALHRPPNIALMPKEWASSAAWARHHMHLLQLRWTRKLPHLFATVPFSRQLLQWLRCYPTFGARAASRPLALPSAMMPTRMLALDLRDGLPEGIFPTLPSQLCFLFLHNYDCLVDQHTTQRPTSTL